MYVSRENKLLLAGFFSAKLKKHQVTWLPCEKEALNIPAAIKHVGLYIIQSTHNTCLLTDSKPCVQAVEKLLAPIFYTDRSKAVLLLWFLNVTCSCCLYLYFGSAIMLVTYFVNFR